MDPVEIGTKFLTQISHSFDLHQMSAYEFITHIFGLIYLVCWSYSLYPQAWENLKRKNVKGFSLEFALLHCVAYLLYCIYTFTGRIDPHYSATGMVVIADVLFSSHGFMLTAVHLTQCLIYQRGGDGFLPKRWCLIFLGVEIGLIFFFFVLEINGVFMPLLLQTQMLCGYGLVVTNICKYSAQFYLNFRRKSTVGFNIQLVFFDFFGALFSLLQLIMDSMGTGEAVVVGSAFNLVKCLLACIGLLMDLAFMAQHFIFYRHAVVSDKRRQVYLHNKDKRQNLTELVQAKLEKIQELEENLKSSSSNQSRNSHVSDGEMKGKNKLETSNILEDYYNQAKQRKY